MKQTSPFKLTLLSASIAALVSLVPGAWAAISVGTSGTAIETFSATPPAADWSWTSAYSGSAGDISDLAGLDAAVQSSVKASDFTGAMASEGNNPPTAHSKWYLNTVNNYVFNKASDGQKFSPLMAFLVNNTDKRVGTLTVNYDFGKTGGANEALDGITVYYSFTGLVGSWTRVANVTTTGTGLTLPIDFATPWSERSKLHLIFVDDNRAAGSGSEPIFWLDNVSFTPSALTDPPATRVAYNDCATTNSPGNPPNTTLYAGNMSGQLKDFNTGETLPIKVQVVSTANSGTISGDTLSGDAATLFSGKVVFTANETVMIYAGTGWYSDLIFTGLDPAKEYSIATTANRGNASYTGRLSKFTISDVDASVNASSAGVTVNSETSVTFCTGGNTAGYVARWNRIKCGADGGFKVRVEDGGGDNKGYGPTAFMLIEDATPIAIATPVNNQAFALNVPVSIVAAAVPAVTNVDFYADGVLLGSSATAPFSYEWTGATAGSHALTAVAMQDTGFTTTSSVVNITVGVQTISFNAPAHYNMGDSFDLTGSASSGLPVAFSVSGPATLSGNTVTCTGVGIVTVTASQEGDASYLAATPVVRTFFSKLFPQEYVAYDFEDNSLQGWMNTKVSSSASGYLDLAFGPAQLAGAQNGGLSSQDPAFMPSWSTIGTSGASVPPGVGTYFLGQIPMTNYSVTVDWANYANPGSGAHQTIWVQSPRFVLNGSGDLTYIGSGSSQGIVVDHVANIPAIAGTWGTDSGNLPETKGSIIVGLLRDDGVFVLTKDFSGSGWPTYTFTTSQLAPFVNDGHTYTLNLIDFWSGRNSWAAIDNVSIPGTIQKDNQTITGFGTISNRAPGSFDLLQEFPDMAASSGLPLSFTVSGPASVSGSVVTLTGAGEVTITANQAGNGQYHAAAPVSQTFTVLSVQGSQTITFDALVTRSYGETFTVIATASSSLPVTLAITGPATLDGTTVTCTGLGTVTITASQSGNESFLAAEPVSQSFEVVKASQTITFAAIGNKNVGETVALGATASSGLVVSYTVSGPATLTDNTLTFTDAGMVTVTASQPGDANYNSATDVSRTFEVKFPTELTVANFGFEAPVTDNYIYGPADAGWTFENCGIAKNNSAFVWGSWAPEGVQQAFLQDSGTFYQALEFSSDMTYRVTFKAREREQSVPEVGQTWNVELDDVIIASFTRDDIWGGYSTYTTPTFKTTTGTHVLRFRGTNLKGGDNTIFIDDVKIPQYNSSFGLTGEYFTNKELSGSPTVTRLDPVVDFTWGDAIQPDPLIPASNYSVRWTGQVMPRFSEEYTFYAAADDGIKLWVNDVLLVDQWIDQGETEYSGKITLEAGQKYAIKMEYYQGGGGASARLRWSSASTPKEIIPQMRLFPAVTTHPAPALMPVGFADGSFSLTLQGDVDVDYILQVSTNLTNWTSISTNRAVSMPMTLIDAAATDSFRFYRVLVK